MPMERAPLEIPPGADLFPRPAHAIAVVDIVEDEPTAGPDTFGEQRQVRHRALITMVDVDEDPIEGGDAAEELGEHVLGASEE